LATELSGDCENESPDSLMDVRSLVRSDGYPILASPGERILQWRLMGKSIDLLQGTLDLLVLKTLAIEPMHGWGISQRIQQVSQDSLQVQQGSLYPALHRLEQQGWITSEWGASENNRKAKYYRLTASGRKQLEVETERWERLSAAVSQILATA
jgi:PadR family transcriptional regulator, regulatory protein PadR